MTADDGAQPDEAFRAAMRRLIADRWAEAWDQLPDVLAGKDPEAVHDLRVASRRVRAAMDVAVDCFPSRWYRRLHRTAQRLTRALGDVRDLDIVLEALAVERDQATDEERPGIEHLIARVRRKRKRARKQMIAFLTGLDRKDVRNELRRRFPVDDRAATHRGDDS